MSRALFTAVAGLKSHQTKMDVIGNNIANVSTYGFKTGRVTFRDVFYQNIGNGGGSNALSGGLGGQNPYQVGYGTMVATIDTNQTKTGFASTGIGSDCYLNGDGFFVVGTLNTDETGAVDADQQIGQVYYTRLGSFDFDSAGFLVDGTGQLVCGIAGAADENGHEALVPIYYNPNKTDENGATANDNPDALPLKNITLGADGLITAMGNDGITYGFSAEGDGTLVALSGEGAAEDAIDECVKIAVANILNPNGLEMVGNSYYTASANAGTPEYYQAGTNNMGAIKTGGLEMSGTDISQEFAEMIMTQRGFQANSRIVTVVDSMLEEVVNMKR